MRWRTAAKVAYLSNSRSSGWPASTKVMAVRDSEVEVDHALDGGESGRGEVLSVIDDDDRFLVEFGNDLEEQLAGSAGEEGGIDLEFFEDRLDETGGGEAGAADVERGVAIGVQGGDEGGESDRLAAADGAGEQQQVLVGNAKGEPREGLLMGFGREDVGGREVLAERQAGEAEEGEYLIMHRHRGAPCCRRRWTGTG